MRSVRGRTDGTFGLGEPRRWLYLASCRLPDAGRTWRPRSTRQRRALAIVGSAASIVLFVIYLGPWAVIPLAVDLFILWGALIYGWTRSTFATA